MTVCPECYDGFHSQCIGQGCDCLACRREDANIPYGYLECIHGFVREFCELCEQEEQ